MNASINPNHAVKMMESIRNMDSDVTLVAGDSAQKFPVHRVIMMAASKFFKALLGPNFREGNQEEVVLKEIDGTTLKSIIDYCYTGNIKFTEDNVPHIAAAASSFEMVEVEIKCDQFWELILSNKNAVLILRMANKFSLANLGPKVQKFICENLANISIADLAEINGEDFEKILSSDQIKASEDIVFECLQQWAASNDTERSHYVPKLLETIQLERMESKYLAAKVDPFFEKYNGLKLIVDEYRKRSLDTNSRWKSSHRKPPVIHCIKYWLLDYQDELDCYDNRIYKYNGDTDEWNSCDAFAYELSLSDCSYVRTIVNGKLFVIEKCIDTGITKTWSRDLLPGEPEIFAELEGAVGKNLYGIKHNKYIYTLSSNEHENVVNFERFDTERGTWELKNPIPDISFHATKSIELNNKIYVGSGSLFYCYDTINDQWSKCSSPISFVTHLTKSNPKALIYGLGVDANVQQYDPEQDTWTIIASCPKIPEILDVYHSIDKAYVTCGENKLGILNIEGDVPSVSILGSLPQTDDGNDFGWELSVQ